MKENLHIYTDMVSFGYDSTCQPSQGYTLHCHTFYEVYYFLEGNVDYLVEGHKYTPQPNSLLLLSPHAFHGARVNDEQPYRRYSLHFNPDILTAERRAFLLSAFPSPQKRDASNIYYTDTDRFGLSTYFSSLKNCARQQRPIQEMTLPICIEALLSQIVSMCEQNDAPLHVTEGGTVSEIIFYLNRHLNEEITLDQLSGRFFISKHHLNKVFRKATGTTVFDYLLHKRITVAQQLLINGASAQAAALEAGFRDYSSFYRSYLRILGHSPVQDKGVPVSFAGKSAGMEQVRL